MECVNPFPLVVLALQLPAASSGTNTGHQQHTPPFPSWRWSWSAQGLILQARQ